MGIIRADGPAGFFVDVNFDWVGVYMRDLLGGILGAFQFICIIALIVSMGVFVWSKLTQTLIDNPRGLSAILGVIVGSALGSALTTGIGWGTGLFNGPVWLSF